MITGKTQPTQQTAANHSQRGQFQGQIILMFRDTRWLLAEGSCAQASQPLGSGVAGHRERGAQCRSAGHSLGGGRQPTEQLSAPSGGRTVASTVITDGL